MLAGMTGLRRGVPTVNLDQASSVPVGFVFQLSDKLTPSYVADSLSQCGVLDHVLDSQALHTHHLVFVDDAGGELMLVVSSPVGDTSMDFGYFETCLGAVLGALLFPGMPTLGFCQLLLILGKVAWVANGLPRGEGHHGLETKVKPDHLRGDRKWVDILLHQDGDEVAVGTILGDRDRTGLGPVGQRSMPADIQRLIHLGKSQQSAIPLERIGGIGSRLLMPLFLERRVVGSPLKEIDKRSIQVPKSLLNGNRRDRSKPRVLLFESRQHGRQIVIVEALSLLKIGRLTGRESPVVDKADTSERLSKNAFLFIGRIEAEFVGPLGLLAHGLFAFLLLFYVLLNGVDDLAISRSLVLFGSFLESLQKSRLNVNRKALCLHTGIISLFYLYIKQTRSGTFIPSPKGWRVFPRRSDKSLLEKCPDTKICM